MIALLAIFAISLAVSAVASPLTRRAALRIGMLDVPKAHKRHREPTPLLGGLAIYVGVMASMLAVTVEHPFRSVRIPGILVGGSVVFLLGLWDDRRGLHAWIKLAGQLVAAGGLIAAGVQAHVTRVPVLDAALTVVWVVGLTNAFNFIDNMDGLCAGVGAVAATTFLFWAIDNGQVQLETICAATTGATLGFLIHNFPPASQFMGDAGSLFIGFTLAALATDCRFPSAASSVHWLIPVLVLGVPVFDLVLVTVSRLRRGAPIYVGSRDHVSHRLRRAGLSDRQTVLVIYLACAGLGALGFLIARAGQAVAFVLVGLLLAAAGVAIVLFERRVHAVASAPATPRPVGPDGSGKLG